jgi:hypothetical protein
MANINNFKKAILVHGHTNVATGTSNQATGSFAQLYATGSATFTTIEYGYDLSENSTYTPSSIISDEFIVPQGATVYGPIGRFTLKSGSAGVLAYVK